MQRKTALASAAGAGLDGDRRHLAPSADIGDGAHDAGVRRQHRHRHQATRRRVVSDDPRRTAKAMWGNTASPSGAPSPVVRLVSSTHSPPACPASVTFASRASPNWANRVHPAAVGAAVDSGQHPLPFVAGGCRVVRTSELPCHSAAPVHLSGLADAVLADPTLDEAIADARGGMVRALDLTGPAALRPFVVDGLVRAGRTVLAVTATAREAEDLVEELGVAARPGHGRATTRAGRRCRTSGSARAATRSAAGWRCCAGWRTRATTRQRPAPGRRRAGPLGAPAAGQGARRPRAGRAGPRPDRAARGRRAAARRRGVLPGRPGRAARRVRGPRRHRRRLPADRGAPAAGGVLGRRRRGDPHASRSPTSAPSSRSTGSGRRRAASCCSPTTYAGAPASSAEQHPQLARADRQDRRRHRRRGHGVADARAGRRDGAARRPAARPRPTCWCSTPSGCAAGPTTWSRPARSSSARAGRPPPAAARRRSTSAPRRTAPSATSARTPSAAGQAWWTVSPFGLGRRRPCVTASDVDDRRACRPAPCRRRPPTPTAATSTAPSPTSTRWRADGYRVVVVHPGHGPAQRTVEVLGEHDVAGPAGRRRSTDATRPTRRGHGQPAARSPTASSTRPTGWSCSPARTSPASAPRPATCARCRPGASARSTRSSSPPATTSSTSSTASAASSR